jgi:hypothetical protein
LQGTYLSVLCCPCFCLFGGLCRRWLRLRRFRSGQQRLLRVFGTLALLLASVTRET